MASSAETSLRALLLTAGDCAKLMPDGSPDEAARVAELEAHLKALEARQAEAEAKHRLYTLLFERTRWPSWSFCAATPDLACLAL